MDIAILSMAMSQGNVMQQASVSVMKMSMNQAAGQNVNLIQQMQVSNQNLQQVAQPHLGRHVDISV